MNVYRYIFFIGIINLIVPFLGISFIYKQYIAITLSILTIGYALLLRTSIKEKEYFQEEQKNTKQSEKTINEIIEMEEDPVRIISDVVPKKRGRKPRVLVNASSEYDE